MVTDYGTRRDARRLIQGVGEHATAHPGPSWAKPKSFKARVERATDAPEKGVAAAKSRDSADVKEGVVVKRWGLSSERGKG